MLNHVSTVDTALAVLLATLAARAADADAIWFGGPIVTLNVRDADT